MNIPEKFWSERPKGVEVDDWLITIKGTDGIEYGYDGSTDSINHKAFIEEVYEDN